MKRPPDGLGPIIPLDRRLGTPLHRQLYEGYRDAIVDGRLRPGQRLPSTRTLAHELHISRIPVVTAFEQLVAEGYVDSRVGAGSFVSSALAQHAAPARSRPGAPAAPRGRRRIPRERLHLAIEPWLASWGAFRVGQPVLDEFPADTWARLVARRSRLAPRRQMMVGDVMGFAPLREVLADHLRTARSVRCSAQQIMIARPRPSGRGGLVGVRSCPPARWRCSAPRCCA